MVLVLAKEKMQINRMELRPGVHGPLVLAFQKDRKGISVEKRQAAKQKVL